jgi:hypothetical protein
LQHNGTIDKIQATGLWPVEASEAMASDAIDRPVL